MEYISIKNWEKFQHYHDRNPPWIKFYHSILDDYEYGCLQDDSKLLLVSLYLLASRSENKIPNDPAWIKQKAMLSGKINLEPLIRCGFISINANGSGMLATCQRNATVTNENGGIREETETEKRREEKEAIALFIDKLNIKQEWENFRKHRLKVRAGMTPYAEKLILQKLDDYKTQGYDPADCINITIEKGWKDIKLEWIKKEFK